METETENKVKLPVFFLSLLLVASLTKENKQIEANDKSDKATSKIIIRIVPILLVSCHDKGKRQRTDMARTRPRMVGRAATSPPPICFGVLSFE